MDMLVAFVRVFGGILGLGFAAFWLYVIHLASTVEWIFSWPA
jgi:hypothetical protein